VLAHVNAYLRPLVVVLTLPINILTLGLFTLVINALMLMLVSWLIPTFHVEGFWTAVGGALVISVVSVLLNSLLTQPRIHMRVHRG
jgi:putative membrane protein